MLCVSFSPQAQTRSCSPFWAQVASFTVVHSPNECTCASVAGSVIPSVASSVMASPVVFPAVVPLGVCGLLPLSHAVNISAQASKARQTSIANFIVFFIFFLLRMFNFFGDNKKCANRSQRTEKRKLQLSPNKTNSTDKHLMQVSGISVLPILILTCKKGIGYKTPYKNRAFILKNYLVLFGSYIVSHFSPFVNPEPPKNSKITLKNAHQ